MAYQYLPDIAIADIAFEASHETREGMFTEAGKALLNVMVENTDAVRPVVRREIRLQENDLERLLFEFLQTLIFYKDSEQLLLTVPEVAITEGQGRLGLIAHAAGEAIDRDRHELGSDVKAVTLHRFGISHDNQGFKATVVLDI